MDLQGFDPRTSRNFFYSMKDCIVLKLRFMRCRLINITLVSIFDLVTSGSPLLDELFHADTLRVGIILTSARSTNCWW